MHASPLVAALQVLGGFALLLGGAEALVRGASRLAAHWGVNPIVVGLTIVAFGTSAPELLVSLAAAVKGQGDIALGNVVGSNLFNTLVVVGVAALIRPIDLHQRYVRQELPIMLAATAALWLALRDLDLTRIEGAVGLAGLAAFLFVSYRSADVESPAVTAEYGAYLDGADPRRVAVAPNVALVVGGSAALAFGGTLLVDGATTFARLFGVSERLIAVTLVAVGTSLPELATTIVAAWRGERDIAVANAIGSNVFNILLILGLPALIRPIRGSASILAYDVPAVAIAGALLLPIFATGGRIRRAEGGFLLALYAVYVAALVTGRLDA